MAAKHHMKQNTTRKVSPLGGTIVGYISFERRPRSRRHLVAVLPDGTERHISRRNDGYYNGPDGSHCSPLNYALEKWRDAGAKIERREVAAH